MAAYPIPLCRWVQVVLVLSPAAKCALRAEGHCLGVFGREVAVEGYRLIGEFVSEKGYSRKKGHVSVSLRLGLGKPRAVGPEELEYNRPQVQQELPLGLGDLVEGQKKHQGGRPHTQLCRPGSRRPTKRLRPKSSR